MRRIAYILSAYTDAPHLARLVAALDDGKADFYVHIDRKVDSRPFHWLLDGKATFVPSHSISWGGWQQVEYQKELLAAVLHSGQDYMRIVCLSGQDYPLWSNARIRKFFEDNPETEFICGMDLTTCTDRKQREKVTLWHFFRDLHCKSLWWKNKLIAGSRSLMRLLPWRKKPTVRMNGREAHVFFGSDYWALTLSCAHHVYETLCREKELARYFRTSFVPSELCVQTIVFNSPFAAKALRYEGPYPGLPELTPLHYIDYGQSIKILTEDDLPVLLHADKMYCRKVVSGVSDRLADLIDKRRAVAEKETVPEQKDSRVLTIIVTYNFERWIDRCMQSLRQSEQKTDIVIIDNASQDHTTDLLRTRYPEARLICNRENTGFGHANNIGMAMAMKENYDYVFLLNQDAWIGRDTLGMLIKQSLLHLQYGILSPMHLTGTGDRLDRGFAAYAGLNGTDGHLQVPAGETPVECPFINAAFWLIPVTVLKRTGGFCPLFRHYGEDVDYVNRLHYRGYRIGYVPGVYGCHDRQGRKPTRQDLLRADRVYLLAEYANINRSLAGGFAYGVLAAFKKAAKALARRDFRPAKDYTGIAFHLLGRTREVIRYRRINRKGGRIYIE